MKRIKESYDFCVVGGGVAGVCCALAAARNGARTALVQDRPVLGGNSSSEVGVGPIGSQYYNAFTMETGIVGELLLADRTRNHAGLQDAARTNSVYDLTLYDKCREEKNLTLHLNTTAYEVITENDKITSLLCRRPGGTPDLFIEARQFADCTGDGSVALGAGAHWDYGRESREEFGEGLAVAQRDEGVMGSSIVLLARNMGRKTVFTPPSFARAYNDDSFGYLRGPFIPSGEAFTYSGWFEIGLPYHTVHDSQLIYEDLLSHVFGVWDYIKNKKYIKESENYALDWVSPVLGKRESRRFLGDYRLTVNDCLRDQSFYDAVSFGGWFVDEHTGLYAGDMPPVMGIRDAIYENYTLVAPYTVPLRCLYSRNIENLWFAGRNISVTHLALCSLRVQATLGLIGQAAGTAAAYSLARGLTPRRTAEPDQVEPLRQLLIKDGVFIPNCMNREPEDLARTAGLKADSALLFTEMAPSGQKEALNLDRAQIFPLNGWVEAIDVFVERSKMEGGPLKFRLESVKTLWQQEDGQILLDGELDVPGEFKGYASLHVGQNLEKGLYRLILKAHEQVAWYRAQNQPGGTQAQYLFANPEDKVIHGRIIPSYRKYNQKSRDMFSHSLKIRPAQNVYGIENVAGGRAWPYEGPNLWMTDSQKPWIEISLDREREVSRVILYRDVDLNCSHSRMEGFWHPQSCPNAFKIYGETQEGEILLYTFQGDPCHKTECRFQSTRTNKLILRFDNEARYTLGLYEIRVY